MHVQSHAAGYVALEKGLIDWDNYEAKVAFFPIRFRHTVTQPALDGIALQPHVFRPRFNRGMIDAVYVWKMPADSGLDERLGRYYKLVYDEGGGALYEIKRRRTASSGPR